MKLSPDELVPNGYILQDKLDHKEIIPFVQLYLKKRNIYTVFYYAANIFLLLLIFLYFFVHHRNATFLISDVLMYLSVGFVLAFTLIPIHEYIHALAYKYVGAENTSYDANLRKFYFMAMADQFVASRREFRLVALAPFLLINLVSIFLFFTVPLAWTYTVLGTLLTHTAFCSGDFGLLSYFEFHQDKEVVTYDDKENQVSYFYGRSR